MIKHHRILCEGARPTAPGREWRDAELVHLRIGKGRKDVHLHVEHISRKMCANLPSLAADLLEIAAFVYAADQMFSRGGTKEFEYGLRWRRRLRFEIPVRCPEIWRQPAVSNELAETLGFLSDDDYEFAFSRSRHPRPLSGYLYPAPEPADGSDFQEVILFSGGLDSLGGAIQEILQGHHRVALVSHRPVNKLYTRQCHLVSLINDLLPERRLRPLHVAVEVNKGKSLSHDFMQRSRSFLFAAMAAIVARMFHLQRIRFYENGVIALNLPISPQVLGGRATRTAHPRVLKGFARLFSRLFECDFRVENPFQWKTRTEILAEIRTAGRATLCAPTSSCTRTLITTTQHTHCGRCSQCVDRRLAALAAELSDEEDPGHIYGSNVVTDPRDRDELTLIERYFGTARRVEGIDACTKFIGEYAEASRVLRHMDVPPARAAELIFDLYQRHSSQILGGLVKEVRAKAEDLVRGRYPPNCLLRLACGKLLGSSQVGEVASPANGQHAEPMRKLVVDEKTFTAYFAGKDCFLGNTMEFWVLARLNQTPGVYVSYNDFRDDVWKNDQTENNTIQRTISNLRRKLRDKHMTEVQINGQEKGHYQLVLLP